MMQVLVDKETERRLAEAALFSTSRGEVLTWNHPFFTEQVQLMLSGACDARAHDITCAAMPLFRRLKEAL